MRFFLSYFVASMCIALCTLSENCSMASDSAPLDKVGQEKMAALTKLRQEKLKAAKDRYDAVRVGFEAGVLPIPDVYAASRDWKDSAYEAAKTKKDRRTALEQHHERMAKLYEQTHGLAAVNARGGEADKDSSAHFWELEAKVWLLEEGAKP